MAMNPAIQSTNKDRRLYLWFAALMPLIVLAGFARTYYLKGFFGTPSLPGLLVHLHGLVMTTWVVLFITQVTLVATRRTRTHMRLGIFGAGLAALVVWLGAGPRVSVPPRGGAPGAPRL